MNNIEGAMLIGGGGALLLLGVYLLVKGKPSQNGDAELRQNGQREAEEITIKSFLEMLREDPEITLDDAIVKFEGGDYDSLEDLSQRKSRPIQAYRDSYAPFFMRAQHRLDNTMKEFD